MRKRSYERFFSIPVTIFCVLALTDAKKKLLLYICSLAPIKLTEKEVYKTFGYLMKNTKHC